MAPVLPPSCRSAFSALSQHRVVQAAQLEGEGDLSGDDVGRVGDDLHGAHCAHDAVRAGHLFHRQDEGRRLEQGIVALVHGRGARVVGHAAEHHGVAAESNDPVHHPHGDVLCVEDTALFDVQLQIGGHVAFFAFDGADVGEVHSRPLQQLGKGLAGVHGLLKELLFERPCHEPGAEGTARGDSLLA